jgi:hypothetical protein
MVFLLWTVHKVVMAACSRFFKEQLCKYNVQSSVILRSVVLIHIRGFEFSG